VYVCVLYIQVLLSTTVRTSHPAIWLAFVSPPTVQTLHQWRPCCVTPPYREPVPLATSGVADRRPLRRPGCLPPASRGTVSRRARCTLRRRRLAATRGCDTPPGRRSKRRCRPTRLRRRGRTSRRWKSPPKFGDDNGREFPVTSSGKSERSPTA